MSVESKFQSNLANLQKAYVESLTKTIAHIDQLTARQHKNQFDLESLQELKHMAHKLSGSGKTFGFPAISDKARELEQLILQIESENKNGEFSRFLYQQLFQSISALKFSCQEACQDVSQGIKSEKILENNNNDSTLIYVATGKIKADITSLISQLQTLGYIFKILDHFLEIPSAFKEEVPSAIIIATDFSEKDNSLLTEIMRVNSSKSKHVPVLYVSGKSDFETRLQSVRLGGDGFFVLSDNITSLINQVDYLISRNLPQYYHVLIIDDDNELAARYGLALTEMGIMTTVTSNPKKALQILNETAIDLILLDYQMPRCNGVEFAKVLRQLDRYVSVPIIFLSAEPDLERRIQHIHLGIDDFLTKPISVDQLVEAVKRRAERSLVLHKYMIRDSATGLLNHTRLKESLSLEIARARRSSSKFSYALLDIDHFKKVNDQYGHATGDVVIKTFARLLQSRLRRTDIVGRYGGEEFGVILLDTNEQEALKILNDIKDQFASMSHIAASETFHVTVSGGIATFPEFSDEITISEAADQALYQAKEMGRNRIIQATKSNDT